MPDFPGDRQCMFPAAGNGLCGSQGTGCATARLGAHRCKQDSQYQDGMVNDQLAPLKNRAMIVSATMAKKVSSASRLTGRWLTGNQRAG